MDIEIRKFRKMVIDLINNTQLPIEVKRLVISDILLEITKVADDLVMQMLQAQQKQADNDKVADFPIEEKEAENG